MDNYTLRLLGATLLFCCGSTAFSGELVLRSPVLERDGITEVVYRLDHQVTGKGEVSVHWTDSLGRIVEDRTFPVELTDEDQFSFPLDVRRAIAMKNALSVHLSLDGTNKKGEPEHKDEESSASFVARPSGSEWRDYMIVMWQNYPANFQPALEKLGVNAGEYKYKSHSLPDFLIDNNVRWYSEGIGTDFYSTYHQWRSDRPYNWDLLQAKELYKRNPSSKEAFKRHPSFWDPEWRAKIHDRLVEDARKNSPYRPLFYSLADEAGIADLAAFWDFDFSDQSLAPMRTWLRERYSTLANLNTEWGTKFASWDLVTPMTTHEAMQQKDDNFASWADFKEWMDISFADALKLGTDAVHEVDKDAYVGIGGGQMPSWGGYDYSRIAKAITAIEPYDIGGSVEIIRSLNPDMPMLSTGFANGDWEQQRVWYELLHGHRGLIIWDDKHEYLDEHGKPEPRGEQAAKYYNEIRDGIGALIINSRPVTDSIAIHYSQPSMRTEWMLARRPEGDAWLTRSAKTERTDNNFMRLRESWCKLIEDQGLQYKFVAYNDLANGRLLRGGYRVLVLPQSSALSQEEADAIHEFVAQGGIAIADGEPGGFDEHSRRLPQSAVADLFGGPHDKAVTVREFGSGKTIFLKADTLGYLQSRLVKKEGPVDSLVGNLLRANGIHPEFAVTDASGRPVVGVETHIFENGGVRLITLLSNPQSRVDELGPTDFRSNQRFESPVTVNVALPEPMYLYNVRQCKSLGEKRQITITLNPYEPAVFAATAEPLPELRIGSPEQAKRGSTVHINIDFAQTSAALHVVRVDVVNPAGERVLYYSENVFAQEGHAAKILPLAYNDPAGTWTVRIHDLLSGQQKIVKMNVK
jgi:hypothetical protein